MEGSSLLPGDLTPPIFDSFSTAVPLSVGPARPPSREGSGRSSRPALLHVALLDVERWLSGDCGWRFSGGVWR